MKEVKSTPLISLKSQEIFMKKSIDCQNFEGIQSYMVDTKTYFEDQRKKEQDRLKIKQKEEMKDFTGKPEINQKSKNINRNIEDLYDWKVQQDRKKEEEVKRKMLDEQIQIQKMQQQKILNKASQKMLQHLPETERVEDRLFRQAKLKKNKVEQRTTSVTRSEKQKTNKSLNQVVSGSKQRKNQSPLESTFPQSIPYQISQSQQSLENIYSIPNQSEGMYPIDNRVKNSFQNAMQQQRISCPNVNTIPLQNKEQLPLTTSNKTFNYALKNQNENQHKKTNQYVSLFQKIQSMNNASMDQNSIYSFSPNPLQIISNGSTPQTASEKSISSNISNALSMRLQQQIQEDRQQITQILCHQMPLKERFLQTLPLKKQIVEQIVIKKEEENQVRQDYLISKILENSYIPNGNCKNQRKFLEDEEIQSFDKILSLAKIDQQYPFSQTLPNNLYAIDSNSSKTSDKEIVKNLNNYLEKIEIKDKKEIKVGSKIANFFDRNNQWQKTKNQKLFKIQELKEKRQEKECPFQPNQSGEYVSKTSRSQSQKQNFNHHSNKENQRIKPQEFFSGKKKETREQEIQCTAFESEQTLSLQIKQLRDETQNDLTFQDLSDFSEGMTGEMQKKQITDLRHLEKKKLLF